jgi:hypothetical protein
MLSPVHVGKNQCFAGILFLIYSKIRFYINFHFIYPMSKGILYDLFIFVKVGCR